jgi:HlyD family secretion protein
MKKWIKRIVAALVVLAAIGITAAWYRQRGTSQTVAFETAKVTRGNLLVTIAASGTLEPEEVVDVGAQISGRILSFGKDTDDSASSQGWRVQWESRPIGAKARSPVA